MTALAKNRKVPKTIQRSSEGFDYTAQYPVEAAAVIYEGSFVTVDTTGYVHVVDTADGQFVGVALEKVTGGTSSGDVTVKVGCGGIIEHAVTGAGLASPGAASGVMDVYASDDNTLTLTATGGVRCGQVVRHVSSTTVWVKLKLPQGPIS